MNKILKYHFIFDKTKENNKLKKKIWEVSIANLPNYHKRGLGSKMLKLSISKFRKLKNPKKIISTVKKFNKRSQKCFLKVNFKKIKFDKKKHITLSKINLKKENYYEK